MRNIAYLQDTRDTDAETGQSPHEDCAQIIIHTHSAKEKDGLQISFTPHRHVQLPQLRQSQTQKQDVGRNIETWNYDKYVVDFDAMSNDRGIPQCIDGDALEDCQHHLSGAIDQDESIGVPECNVQRDVDAHFRDDGSVEEEV